MSSTFFYDPVRCVIASVMEYATGPSNGNPAIPISEALETLKPQLLHQQQANRSRIALLTELQTALAEAKAISYMRHSECAANIKTLADSIVASIRERERDLLHQVQQTQEAFIEAAEAREKAIDKRITDLTAATNTLSAFLSEASNSDETEGTAALESWSLSQRLTAEQMRYVDTLPDVAFSVTATHDSNEVISNLILLHECQYTHRLVPQLVTEPTATLSVADTLASGEILAPPPRALMPAVRIASDSIPVARGLIFSIGSSSNGNSHRHPSQPVLEEPSVYYRNVFMRPVIAAPSADGRLSIPRVRVLSSVPLAAGDVKCLGQPALFGPRSAALHVEQVRTIAMNGAVVWWDFGEHHAVDLHACALVHGGTHLETAMRGWSVIGTNEEPPVFGASQCRERSAVEQQLASFFSNYCVVLLARSRDSSLGMKPLNVVYCRVGEVPMDIAAPHPRTRTFRYLGVRVDEPTGPAKDRCHVHLAGAEWYGVLRRRAE